MSAPPATVGLPDPVAHPLLTVDELLAAKVLPHGRSAAYDAIRRGELPSVRIGGRVLIPTAALWRLCGLEVDQ